MAGIMSLSAQTVYYWRNDQTFNANNYWSSTSPNFFWNGSAGAVPTGGDIIQFEGVNGLVSTNDLVATNRFKINFFNSTASHTLNGSTTNVFYDFGGNHPLIQNWTGVLQTINFPFQIGNESALNYAYGMHIWAGSGGLNIGSTISAANATGVTKELVLTAGASQNLTLSGVISDGSGAIKLAKWGAGTLFLSGNNTYSGTTIVSDGTLKLGSSTALGSIAGSTTVNTGYSLDLNGMTYTNAEPLNTRGAGFSGAGAVNNSSSTPATFPGLLTLLSASTITGGAGTIALSNTGTITGAYDLTLDGASGGSVASIIGIGAGNLVKNGTGIWKLSAINTYTGQTQINNGELWIESGGDINTASAIWLGNGGTLSTSAKIYLSSLTGGTTFARAINVNAGDAGTRIIGGQNTSGTNTFSGNIIRSSNQPLTVDVPNSGGSLTLSGTINGSGEFKKIGNGTLTISGTNSGNFGGSAWNIEQGTMSFAFFGTNLNAKPVILGNAIDIGTVIYTGSGGAQTVPISTNAGGGKLINISTGDLSITPVTQTQTIAGTFEIACNSIRNVSIAYILNGAGGLKVTSTSTGILTLSRANTYSGITSINSGTLRLGAANAIPSGVTGVQSAVTINGGTLSTGASSAGFSCGTSAYPMGALTVGASGGTISLATTSSAQNLYFANSSAATWGVGTLNITGWTGTAGSTGTNGHIFIGSSEAGITAAQLAQISFNGYTAGAQILSTGEIVPIQTSISSAISSSTLGLKTSTNLTVASGGALTIDNNSSVNSITVAPGSKLTLGNGNTLTASSGITLQSDATGTATFVDTNNSSPQATTGTVQQYLTDQRNWYTTSPISAGTAAGLNLGTSVQTYSESAKSWTILTGSDALVAGKGYVSVATTGTGTTGTVSFNGTLNTGTITVPVTRTESGSSRGFNLVANPYPSYLDWSLVTSDGSNANIGSTMWFRTKNTLGAYTFATHNGTSGETVTGTANTTITKFIPPLQAFWIRVNTNVGQTTYSTSISFKNGMRAHRDNNGNKLKAPKMDERKRLRLQVSNGAIADETLLYFDANAQDSFDNYDSPKMFNNTTSVPEIYTQVSAEKLVINGLNEVKYNTEIPLGFATAQANDFSIKTTEYNNFEAGTKVILKDKLNPSTEFELSEGAVYNFSSQVTTPTTDRFSLLFRAPGVTTEIDNATKLDVQVFVNANNQITIIAPEKTAYSIYNGVGQLIENGILNSKLKTIYCKLTQGVYVVKVADVSKRVIIK
jgi:autotransporter-associated beta strand protein